ncbi:hypothetical protein NM208_g6443 [Fusarium decemcellulare]|uniref:Uncharacterized protein n=1 Tax=Fusarium decemcellulare TaxID=57161 RepID=A0ACC1SDC1_9HYPO|nr:hypothetical protein NM208_g6443 [Fusarium decemcellulare]
MPRYNSSFDGAHLFYRDFVPANKPPPFQPISNAEARQTLTLVFLHQWPLSSRMYDPLLLNLCETHRFRCIAPDRRGFGQSDWSGPENNGDIDYSVLARDVVDLLEKLKPGPFVFVAASMGTGETALAHSVSDYVKDNCKGFVWISTSLPLPVASADFPDAPPRELWDSVLVSLRGNRSEFVSANFQGPLGVGSGSKVSDKDIEMFERIFDAADALAIERAVQIFTSEDLTDDLIKFGQEKKGPLLLIHGGADGGVPLSSSAERVQKRIPDAQLVVYEGGGHVLVLSHVERLLQDILQFVHSLQGYDRGAAHEGYGFRLARKWRDRVPESTIKDDTGANSLQQLTTLYVSEEFKILQATHMSIMSHIQSASSHSTTQSIRHDGVLGNRTRIRQMHFRKSRQ